MKGDILHYDDQSGTGYIAGDDGMRYTFTRADLKQLRPVGAGTKVDFDVDGRNATDIFIVDRQTQNRGYGAPNIGQPAYAGIAEPELSMWRYFTRALTSNYANFNGRARRKEYWGFFLFYMVILIGVFAVMAVLLGVMAAQAQSASYGGMHAPGIWGLVAIVVALFILATIIPSIALNVRRFHDIGQSGWLVLLFYVLSIIPYVNFVSGIVWIVMLCLDSQPMDNKYGPPPKQFFAAR